MVDEYQDLTDAMLDIVENQKVVITAGDSLQKIYTWKGASGEFSGKFENEEILDKTWRCPKEITKLANIYVNKMSSLNFGTNVDREGTIITYPVDFHKEDNTDILTSAEQHVTWVKEKQDFTIISRTNLSLILYANIYASEYNIHNNMSLDFEDIKNHYLFYKKRQGSNYFLNSMLKNTNSYNKLMNYYKSANMIDKLSLLSIVSKIYKWNTFEKAVTEHDANKPTITVTTLFSAKGLEWDRVLITPDFKHPSNPHVIKDNKYLSIDDLKYLYVAITRSKDELIIPSIYTELCLEDIHYFDDMEGETSINRNIRYNKFINSLRES